MPSSALLILLLPACLIPDTCFAYRVDVNPKASIPRRTLGGIWDFPGSSYVCPAVTGRDGRHGSRTEPQPEY